ncbi:hypothetical protein KIPB_011164, partial [Kipferlia bialata]|eukprot:g11164.t1
MSVTTPNGCDPPVYGQTEGGVRDEGVGEWGETVTEAEAESDPSQSSVSQSTFNMSNSMLGAGIL